MRDDFEPVRYVRQCKLEERLPSNREMFIHTVIKRCMTLCTQDQCAQIGDVTSSCCRHKLKCPSGTDRNSQDLHRTQVSPVSGRLSCIHSYIPWILAQASFSEFFLLSAVLLKPSIHVYAAGQRCRRERKNQAHTPDSKACLGDFGNLAVHALHRDSAFSGLPDVG